MAHADQGDVHVNALLTNVLLGYQPTGFIADEIFPPVFVDKQSDIIPAYDQSPFFRDEGDRLIRAPGTEAQKTGLSVDTTRTYFAVNYALGGDIPWEIRDNQDSPFELDSTTAQMIRDLMLLRRDRSFAASQMVTTTWGSGTDFSATAKWSDYGSSTPIQDMRAMMRNIRRRVGRRGNKFAIGDLVWQRMQDHPALIDRMPDNSLRMPTREMLSNLLELGGGTRILVGESMVTTDPEGTAEASVSYSDVWDDDVLCIYVPDRPALMEPAAGYTFFWRNSVAPNAQGFVRTMDDTKKKVRTVEEHAYWHQNRVLAGAGEFFPDAVD